MLHIAYEVEHGLDISQENSIAKNVRQCCRTGQLAQTALARWISAMTRPAFPIGKNSSVSRKRRQLTRASRVPGGEHLDAGDQAQGAVGGRVKG